MFIAGLGATVFGVAIGWIAYRILRQRASTAALSDFFTLLGVIGGAAVIALFKSDVLFGLYAIGLVIGFFAYLAVGLVLYGKQEVQPWRIEQIPPTPTPGTPSSANPPDVGQEVQPRQIEQIPPTPTPETPSSANPPDVGNARGSSSQPSRRSKTSNANPTNVENAS